MTTTVPLDLTRVDLLAVARRLGCEPRRAGSTSGGEWSAPCPICGNGEDRLRLWPNHPDGRGRWWCRQCDERGDAVDLVRQTLHLDFPAACDWLGIDLPDPPLPNGHHPSAPRPVLTVAALAEHYGLDGKDLTRRGAADHQRGVAFTFKSPDGSPCGEKVRLSIEKPTSKEDRRWIVTRPMARPTLFGAEALAAMREQSDTVLVHESELDAIVDRVFGIPAVATGGKDWWNAAHWDLLAGFARVIAWREDDEGARLLAKMASTRPADGPVFLVAESPDEAAKDPGRLLQRHGPETARALVASAIAAARPFDAPDGDAPPAPGIAQNPEAERALLTSILSATDPLAALAPGASPDDFRVPAHRCIYAALLRLVQGEKPAGPAQVRAEIRREAASGAAKALLAGDAPVEETVADAAAAIAALEAMTLRRRASNTAELVSMFWESVDTPRPDPVRTGFHDLDARIGGLLPGQLITVAALTRMGKSSFCLGIAHHVGMHLRLPVGVISLEMPELEVLMRLACLTENLSTRDIQDFNTLDDTRQQLVMETMGKIGDAPIAIDGSGERDLASVLDRARAMHARFDLRLLMIDYAQLLRDGGGGRNDNRTVELGRVSGALKQLAMELGIPILTAAQINRSPLSRADKMPDLEDIRESASIAMDSDIVVVIHRPGELDHERSGDVQARAEVKATVAKNRHGETGPINLRFVPHRAMFVSGTTRLY